MDINEIKELKKGDKIKLDMPRGDSDHQIFIVHDFDGFFNVVINLEERGEYGAFTFDELPAGTGIDKLLDDKFSIVESESKF